MYHILSSQLFYSFASGSDDLESLMFPDSNTGKGYQREATMVKYVTYSFKFNKSTFSKKEKQYDIYAQFWSNFFDHKWILNWSDRY